MEVKGLWGINNIMIDHITHIYGSKRSLVESITLWFNPDLWNWKVFWGINNIMIDPITQIYGSEGCLWNQQHYDRSHNPDLWKWKVTWGINNNMIDPITQIYRSEGSLGNQHMIYLITQIYGSEGSLGNQQQYDWSLVMANTSSYTQKWKCVLISNNFTPSVWDLRALSMRAYCQSCEYSMAWLWQVWSWICVVSPRRETHLPSLH